MFKQFDDLGRWTGGNKLVCRHSKPELLFGFNLTWGVR